jgi:hypothetical protein
VRAMADYDLIQDVNYGQKPKESKETSNEGPESTNVAKAIEHSRPEALGSKGAMHLQRTAGNAAMGALVQRSAEEENQNPVKQVVHGGGGSSLDPGVRSKMEASLGHDFGGVKVHTGPEASAAAKSVQAQAFTVGNNVVFNEGKYNPSSSEGQRTIAHELTHVVQQSKGDVPGTSRGDGVKVSDPSDWAEQQAEATVQREEEAPEEETQELREDVAQREEEAPEEETQELREDVVAQREGEEDEAEGEEG